MTRTILLLDDDGQIRALLRAGLEDLGFAVLEAGTGRAASKMLTANQVDLVVIDGLLPDQNGVDWIAQRRADGVTIPMVFLSAFWARDSKMFRRLTEDLNVAKMVAKPVEPVEFVALLQQLLGADKPQSPAPPSSVMATRLEELRTSYLKRLPGKLQDLRQHVAGAEQSSESREQAITAAHKLAGTAGSFGLPGLGEQIGQLEVLLRAVQSRTDDPGWAAVALAMTQVDALGPGKNGNGVNGVYEPAVASSCHPRLLLVDDDPEFLAYVAAVAQRRTVDVVVTRTQDQAIAACRDGRIDAALIDVRLADCLSHDLPAKLRQLPGYEYLPFGFVSSSRTLEDHVVCAHLGAELFVTKPIEDDILLASIDQLIASRRRSAAKVLIVDDDPDFSAHTAAILGEEGMEVRCVSQPDQAFEMLETFLPDLVLLDMVMPKFSGLDLCRTIRTSPSWQNLAIVFATANNDTAMRQAAFRAGCDDYVTKPVLREELLGRISVRIDRARLAKERGDIDGLTGLWLRRSFVDAVSRSLSMARRRHRKLTLAILDVDHFKQVNDRYGHAVGDRVLAELGHLLGRRFRTEDLRARWGGEEFVLAFPGESPESIRGAMCRLLDEFRAIEFRTEDGACFQATFTAGLAGFPRQAQSLKDLVECADKNLYAGKRLGRNRIIGGEANGAVTGSTGEPTAHASTSPALLAKGGER